MMKVFFTTFLLAHSCLYAFSQVDTSLVYNTNAAYGTLDIRLSNGPQHKYYLQENKTFSFRQDNGESTNTFVDMTAWDSNPYKEGNLREVDGNNDKFVMNYRLLIPDGYDESYSPGYPLVIVLHGLLEGGNCGGNICRHASPQYSPLQNQPPAPTDVNHELLNNDYNLVHAGSNYLEAAQQTSGKLPNDPSLSPRAFPGFVVFPQNFNGWNPASCHDAIRLVRLLIKKYNISTHQVYINGISHGGHGAYETIKRAPWMFSAAVLFSAADDGDIISQNLQNVISHIPLWLFQGGQDLRPTQKQTETYVTTFRKAGVQVRYTLYPQLGHGTWNKAMLEPDFFSWMLKQTNRNIHVPFDSATVCKTSGVGPMLSLPPGHGAYQWEKDGTMVQDVTRHQLKVTLPGTYRARFSYMKSPSLNDWQPWSDEVAVTESNIPAPELSQISTLLLKDLNGNNAAQLSASAGNTNYYWYKNGKLLDLAASADEAASPIFSQSFGDGVYTVAIAGYDGCKSQPSAPKRIVFNDAAPITLSTPENFSKSMTTPSSVSLTWTDKSAGEIGFEIWHRNVKSMGAYSTWEMVTITSPDLTSYVDATVKPLTTYHYKLRAVGEAQRSDYAPSTNSDFLIVTTPPDQEAPEAPLEVVGELTAIREITLTWSPAVDNALVDHYRIIYNEDTVSTTLADTTFALTDLPINTNFRITVRAVDIAGNISPTSQPIEVGTFVNGLFYAHSTGIWNSLKEVDWTTPEFTGTVADFSLNPKTQEDFFNMRFDGFLYLETEGVYQFRISSDDGSRLHLNDTLLIDNDGVHNLNTVTCPIQLLSAGPQHIMVEFFDYVKSDSLLVEYKGPDTGNEWTPISASVLTSSLITSVEDPDADIDYFTLYPNPSRDGNVQIELEDSSKGQVIVALYNYLGVRLYEKQLLASVDNVITVSDFPMLLPGVYFVIVVSADGEAFRKRLVIQ